MFPRNVSTGKYFYICHDPAMLKINKKTQRPNNIVKLMQLLIFQIIFQFKENIVFL